MIFNLITKAKDLFYNNSTSKLSAKNVQAAIDELKSKNDEVNTNLSQKAPTNHASTGLEYGQASTTEYGHVKLCDDYSLLENSKPRIPLVPSQLAIANLYNHILNLLSEKQERIVAQFYEATTTGNWVIVEKTGYHLLNAYRVSDDGSYPVSAIMKRSEGVKYTIFIDGVNNANVGLWLLWMKG